MKKVTIADNAYSARLVVFFDVIFFLLTCIIFIAGKVERVGLFVLLGIFVPTTSVHFIFLNFYLKRVYSVNNIRNLHRGVVFLFFLLIFSILIILLIGLVSNVQGWPVVIIGFTETIFAIYLIKVIFVKARGLP